MLQWPCVLQCVGRAAGCVAVCVAVCVVVCVAVCAEGCGAVSVAVLRMFVFAKSLTDLRLEHSELNSE